MGYMACTMWLRRWEYSHQIVWRAPLVSVASSHCYLHTPHLSTAGTTGNYPIQEDINAYHCFRANISKEENWMYVRTYNCPSVCILQYT